MTIGLDVGYSAVKAIKGPGAGDRVTFASLAGTPEEARFSLISKETIVLVHPEHIQIGEGAIEQSRFVRPREDRSWIESDEWYYLFLGALTELTTAKRAELRIVTGLPVSFFADHLVVRDRLLGEHKAQRQGRHVQSFRVVDCRVIPQPFGALLAATLNDRGRIIDDGLATSSVGVIDVGGKTTNLLSVNRLSEISPKTGSVSIGVWDVVRAVHEWLSDSHPGLEKVRPHQLVEAIIARRIDYYDGSIDLTGVVEEKLESLAAQVLAEATRLWDSGATLKAVLVTGGGALLLEPYVQRHFRHARVVDEPVFANALGYWRFAQRLAGQ
jgi:plasmid segregation protein ParM